jgi:hypothetical protein
MNMLLARQHDTALSLEAANIVAPHIASVGKSETIAPIGMDIAGRVNQQRSGRS